jgi:hypothetical protein
LPVGSAGILSGRRGDTDSLRRACRITARRRDARGPHRLEACAPPPVHKEKSNRRKPTYAEAPARQAKVTKVFLAWAEQNVCCLCYLLFRIFGAQPSWLWGRRASCPVTAASPSGGGLEACAPRGEAASYQANAASGKLPDAALIELAIDCLFKAEVRQTSPSLHWSSSVCPLRIPCMCSAHCLLGLR